MVSFLKHAKCLFVLVLMTLVLAGCAGLTRENEFRYSYSLDTPAGNYSLFNIHNIKNISSMRLRAEFLSAKEHDEWAPAAAFQLYRKDRNEYISILISSDDDLNNFTVQINKKLKKDSGEVIPSESLHFSRKYKIGEEINLKSWWGEGDLLYVDDSDEIKSIQIGFVPDVLVLSSSTSELEVYELVLTQ